MLLLVCKTAGSGMMRQGELGASLHKGRLRVPGEKPRLPRERGLIWHVSSTH